MHRKFICRVVLSIVPLAVLFSCQTQVKKRAETPAAAPPLSFAESKTVDYRQQELLYQAIYHLKNDYLEPLSDLALLRLWLAGPTTPKNWPGLAYKESKGYLTLQCRDRSQTIRSEDFTFEKFWPLYDAVAAPCANAFSQQWSAPYAILKAIVSGLHKGTEFLTPSEMNNMQTEMRGSSGGIGLAIGEREGNFFITEAIEGGPAQKAGVLQGDYLTSVDGAPLRDRSLADVLRLLRGKPGTAVRIHVRRGLKGELQEHALVRENIKIETVKKLPGTTSVLHLQVRQLNMHAVDELQAHLAADRRDLLLDVRACPGGLLDVSHRVSEMFLSAGKVVLSTRGRRAELNRVYTAASPQPDLRRKIVVLTDGNTAGGCEIIAAALRFHGRAKLVGQATYGRGTIENVISMIYNTAMVLTIQEILLPDGQSLVKRPVQPDVALPRDENPIPTALRILAE